MGLNTPVIDAMAMMYERGKANMSDADLEELGVPVRTGGR